MDTLIKSRYAAYLNEINVFQKKVLALWQQRIEKKFGVFFAGNVNLNSGNNKTSLKKYIAIEGGYKIPENEWGSINYLLASFFSNKNHHYNGFVYLRGYDYYANDKNMHFSTLPPSNTQSFVRLSARFAEYRDYVSIVQMLNDDKLSWINYLGIQGYLEWIWNDMATLSWVLIYFNENALIKKFNSIIDQMASIIVESIYGFFAQKTSFTSQLHLKLEKVLSSFVLKDIMQYVYSKQHHEQYIFRALREGDQLWLILASYEFKLLPWIQKSKYKNVTLIGNAFGAINSAFLLKNCLVLNSITVAAENIFYSIHEQEMHRNVSIYVSYGFDIKSDCNECAIVIDDSLFTGKTFQTIKCKLKQQFNDIYCLPLTFDVSTIFNHPEEMSTVGTMEDSINYVEKLIRGIGNNLAPARSFWVFKKRKPHYMDGVSKEYSSKICGSDLLVKILWRRFKEEITGEADRKDSL